MRSVVLFLLLLGVATAGDGLSTREALDLRIPKVAVTDAPVGELIASLRDQTRAADPDGKGLNIVYIRPRPDANGAVPVEPTVTLDFVDIQLERLLTILCATASSPLDCHVDEHAVVISAPGRFRPEMVVGMYELDASVFSTSSSAASDVFGDDDDDDALETAVQEQAGLRTLFTDMGVTFAEGASIHYFEEQSLLVVRNTPKELGMIDRILMPLDCRPGYMVRVTASLVLITDPATIQALPDEPVTAATLAAIPPDKRQVIYRSSADSKSGMSVKTKDSQLVRFRTEDALLRHEWNYHIYVSEDAYRMDLELDWTMSISTVVVDSDADYEIVPLLTSSVETRLVMQDHGHSVFAVRPPRDARAGEALAFLIVQTDMVRPDGSYWRPIIAADAKDAE